MTPQPWKLPFSTTQRMVQLQRRYLKTPHHGTSSNAANWLQAQILPVLQKLFGTDEAGTILDYAQTELQKTWVRSPTSKIAGMNALNFEEYVVAFGFITAFWPCSAAFGVIQSTKNIHNFKPTTHAQGMSEDMFNSLKAELRMSEADIKNQKLSLQVYVYKAQSVCHFFIFHCCWCSYSAFYL